MLLTIIFAGGIINNEIQKKHAAYAAWKGILSNMKRVVTIQDISCFGKCSATVALPIISAMAVETCIVPTAVLSTHTGGFKGYTYRDLTDDMPAISEHWQSISLKFNGIHTGYLGSFKQIKIVSDFIDSFSRRGAVVVIDPVMGDNGKLYSGFTPDFVASMTELCKKADVILPNMTEAFYMLGEEVRTDYTREYAVDMVKRIHNLGIKNVVMTGVCYRDGKQGVMVCDSGGRVFEYHHNNIPGHFHSCGDVLSAALTGALVRGIPLNKAVMLAVDFTYECIKCTASDHDRHWYGIKFEPCIPYLINRLSTLKSSEMEE